MRDIKGRIAYLQGLAEGLQMHKDTAEGKILGEILEILDDMAAELELLGEEQQDFEEYLSAVDESLGELEKDYYSEDGYLDDEEEEYIEVDCPECGERVFFEEEVLDDEAAEIEITCPNCGTVVFSNEIEVEEEEEAEEIEL